MIKPLIIILSILLLSSCYKINRQLRVTYYEGDTTIVHSEKSIETMIGRIKNEDPDIIFYEHIEARHINEMKKSLPKYSFFLGQNNISDSSDCLSPIAYKTKNFTTQTQFFLQLDNVDKERKKNKCGYVLGVKLRENHSGRTLFAINSLIDDNLANDKIYQLHRIVKSYTENLPIILGANNPIDVENWRLITGNWQNFVKLDGVGSLATLSQDAKNIEDRIFINGFLNIDKSKKENNGVNMTTYNISFNRNFREPRTLPAPYPISQQLPYFTDNTIVFNNSLSIGITNPNRNSHIVYTVDESEPNLASPVYQTPVTISTTARIKMRNIQKDTDFGSIVCRYFLKTSITNYRIEKVLWDPPIETGHKISYDYLTDYLKGDEAKGEASWLTINPNQKASITIKLDNATEVNHIGISFATPGKVINPKVAITALNERNEPVIFAAKQNVMGGFISYCGSEGWLIISDKKKVRELTINFSSNPHNPVPFYLDEIVLQ